MAKAAVRAWDATMKLIYRWTTGAVALVTLLAGGARAEPATTNALPKFDEIYQVLRGNLGARNAQIDSGDG